VLVHPERAHAGQPVRVLQACAGLGLDRVSQGVPVRGGELYVDTLKNRRARTGPLVADLHELVDRWASDRAPDEWLFRAPNGGPAAPARWRLHRRGRARHRD
jgi:hypothetical protein